MRRATSSIASRPACFFIRSTTTGIKAQWRSSGSLCDPLRGPVIGQGVKSPSASSTPINDSREEGYQSRVLRDCNAELQGSSVGWGDDYHQSTEVRSSTSPGAPKASTT